MKKSLLFILGISSSIYATEFQFGNGTFTMEGGFLGLTQSIDSDIASYTLLDRHSNMGGEFFYGYDLSWYDSKRLIQAQKTYNSMASDMSIPEMENRVKGLDINLRVGYDVIHEDQDNFLGLGILLGLSAPWIDATKSDNTIPNLNFLADNIDSMIDAKDMFDDSKTEIMTYKIGPTINFQKALMGNKISIYGTGSYAYQTGNIQNDYMDSDFTVDGTFQEYNLGLYFTPFTETFEWGWLTLSPRVYATLGYRYSKWDVEKMTINISGQKMSSEALSQFDTDFSISSSIGYFGLGYSF
jgi:hypothetical protein